VFYIFNIFHIYYIQFRKTLLKINQNSTQCQGYGFDWMDNANHCIIAPLAWEYAKSKLYGNQQGIVKLFGVHNINHE